MSPITRSWVRIPIKPGSFGAAIRANVHLSFFNPLIILFYVVEPMTLISKYLLQLSASTDKVVNAINKWLDHVKASGKGIDVIGS